MSWRRVGGLIEYRLFQAGIIAVRRRQTGHPADFRTRVTLTRPSLANVRTGFGIEMKLELRTAVNRDRVTSNPACIIRDQERDN